MLLRFMAANHMYKVPMLRQDEGTTILKHWTTRVEDENFQPVAPQVDDPMDHDEEGTAENSPPKRDGGQGTDDIS
ncbi:hypothetical protein E2562_013869 [Oryza meyeriana var. granulata]|uniref:Uncharacterized protein n=1 Tax=Oryza meyeriana var. granulata TaxID=110450 RepID=A0A6G1C6X7_9ORYZ|nr:hypothetical protein E2562_013869 [Oryza meyeriana var. granulata]